MPDTQTSQINITIGTAGHVDHGKTALIKLLTGCETDRLKQEKERGLTIELGFAPCRLGELEVGIVDVPGHESFIRTMVAGAAGIDAVIFVVAADDGIMPQTREHLDILTMLDVRFGMVALTKTDIVSSSQIDTVKASLKEFLYGTFLQEATICPISSITGEGFDLFYSTLKNLIGSITPRSTDGVFRQPVERSFSVKGFGTVVSGIPVSGTANTGDEIVLLPHGSKSRIKAIQVYGKDSKTVQSGQCAALNLPQIDYKHVQRGNVLTKGEYFQARNWFLCEFINLNDKSFFVKNGTKLKFHTGTSETACSVYLIEPDCAESGRGKYVQIRTDNPIIAGPNDRYILRNNSPAVTIGGGKILEAVKHKIKRSRPGLIEEINQLAEAINTSQGFIEFSILHAVNGAIHLDEISLRTKLHPKLVSEIISSSLLDEKVVQVSANLYLHKTVKKRLGDALIDEVRKFHNNNPDSVGMGDEDLQNQIGIEKKVFDFILTQLLDNSELILRKQHIALPCHSEQFDPKTQQLLNKIESIYLHNLFSPPKMEDLPALIRKNVSDIQKTVKILIEQQILVRVEKDMYFHSEAIDKAKQRIIEYIEGAGEGRLESVQFKYLLDTTRKYALPMLDYMDKIGVTRRDGNTRYLKS